MADPSRVLRRWDPKGEVEGSDGSVTVSCPRETEASNTPWVERFEASVAEVSEAVASTMDGFSAVRQSRVSAANSANPNESLDLSPSVVSLASCLSFGVDQNFV